MNEVTLHKHIQVGLSEQGCWSYKIPDQVMGVTKPFDIVSSFGGRFVAIEAKIVKVECFSDRKSLLSAASFRDRTHQLRTLKEIDGSGGIGLIVVGFYQAIAPYAKHCYAIRSRSYSLDESWTWADIRGKTTRDVVRLELRGGGELGVRWSFPTGMLYWD